MDRSAINIGIDLGTTNSAIAALEGDRPIVLRNADEMEITPSVVRVDAKGIVTVGRRAKQQLEIDPLNTRAEFKRLMGTTDRVAFEKAQKSFLPEELSAEVLKTLRADARERLGSDVEAAVVTVPALFELSQCEATSRAANLAGFRTSPLLQEPIASAVACGFRGQPTDGFWLVYDLGGGTFDTSLMSAKDGRMSVVDHAGNNFLGGKDFDWKLVQYVIDALKKSYALKDLARGSTKHLRALARLKAACEEAKIELSRKEATSLQLPSLCLDDDGVEVDVDLSIPRSDYEQLILPSLQQTLEICRELLSRHGLARGSLEKLILVGGPTLTPLIREAVESELGIKPETRINPMTIVAEGAAIFAGGIPLEKPSTLPVSPAGCQLQLEFPAISQDLEPYLVGRVLKGSDRPLAFVELSRDDGGWSSGRVPLNAKGGLVVSLCLRPRTTSRFLIRGTDATGGAVEVSPAELTVAHGMTVSDPPLSRSLGVALATNETIFYIQKGAPLPARRTYVHRTVEALRPGASGALLSIPVVQGESRRADRNRAVGVLHIPSANLKRPLPAHSEVEVTLELDRSGRVRAQAFVPLLETLFEEVVKVATPGVEASSLEAALASERKRIADLKTRAAKVHNLETMARLGRVEGLLTELEQQIAAAKGGDSDAAQQASRALLDLRMDLDEDEDNLVWPELELEASRAVDVARSWVISHGGETEKRHLQKLERELRQAQHQRRLDLVESRCDELRKLSTDIALKQDFVWESEFEVLAADLGRFPDLPRASELVARGRSAVRERHMDRVKDVVRELWSMSPVEFEDRVKGHNSGVR